VCDVLGLIDSQALVVLQKNNWNNEQAISDYLENPNKYTAVIPTQQAITAAPSGPSSGNLNNMR